MTFQNMTSEERYVGERLCLKGQNCTVRYIGTVRDKAGTWLGVEWDDPNRGKHNGTHDGTVYFTCKNDRALDGANTSYEAPY